MTFSLQTGTVKNFTNGINEGWYTVTFPTPYPSGSVPLVFAQIQTFAGADTPGLRLKSISNTGFQVRMDEVYVNNATSSKLGDLGLVKGSGDHPNGETLGWMAVEQA